MVIPYLRNGTRYVGTMVQSLNTNDAVLDPRIRSLGDTNNGRIEPIGRCRSKKDNFTTQVLRAFQKISYNNNRFLVYKFLFQGILSVTVSLLKDSQKLGPGQRRTLDRHYYQATKESSCSDIDIKRHCYALNYYKKEHDQPCTTSLPPVIVSDLCSSGKGIIANGAVSPFTGSKSRTNLP